MKNPGKIVQHEDGRIGFAFDKEQKYGLGLRVMVHVVTDDFKPTGDKVLWSISKIKLIGFTD
jgi:hypothetical protein